MSSDDRSSTSSTSDVDSALLHAIVNRLPAMVAYWDREERCRFANRAYEKWFGVAPETMPGRKMAEFLGALYPLNKPHIDAALRGEEQEFEREIPDPAGGPARHSHALYIPDVVDGDVRGFCVLVVDITRRKRAEEALLRVERRLQAMERLTSLATLAAGIAHEINNPLAAIASNLEFMSEVTRTALDNESRAALAEARDAAERIRSIVGSMKLLARGETKPTDHVDVSAVVDQSIAATAHELRYRARIVRDYEEVPKVAANAPQLGQVFVNLLVNAAQALPEGDPERHVVRLSTRLEGEHVVVSVADTGPGILEDHQRRIFEPFFTTKGPGGGAGLGLSISKSIVTGFGGSLDVRSVPGSGATFIVSLPAVMEESAHLAVIPSDGYEVAPTQSTAKPSGRLRVVIIDDDELLRRSLERMLRDHEVISFGNGSEAIAFLTDQRNDVDVILTDLTMPVVSGADVYHEVTRARPELKKRVIVMTGGAFTPSGRAFLSTRGLRVLDKPFSKEALDAMIEACASLEAER